MNARVTLSDVAREAGVSLATASRAINGSADRSVRPDLAARVAEAAARLRYAPDATAQAMARGHTTTLGLLVHDITDPYFSAIAAAVIDAAEAQGLQVTLATTQNEVSREAELVDLMRRQRARAIVLAGGRTVSDATGPLEAAVAAFRAQGGRIAVIGQPLASVPSVALDNDGGGYDLGRALLGLGYRRFAVLTGPQDRVTAADRRGGLLRAIAEGEGEVVSEVPSAFTWEGGHAAMTSLVREGAVGEAQVVVALNDVMALGALAAAREHGIDVPGDVALAGFGGISTLRDVVPGLTTVAIPMAELGLRATRLALGEIGAEGAGSAAGGSAAGGSADVVETVRCEVVLRGSTPVLAPRTAEGSGTAEAPEVGA